MTTVLQYLVVAAVIGLAVFALMVFVFGRGEQLAPLSPRISPTELPERGMTGTDVRTVKFAMALRGYRMSDVDWALERMGGEIDRLRAEIAAISRDASAETNAETNAETGRTDGTEQPVFADAGPSENPSAQSTGDS